MTEQLNFWEDTPFREPKPEPKKPEVNLTAIIDLFDRAHEHLKWPKIRYGKMHLVWTRFKTVMVKVNGDRCAWIQRDGSLQQSKYTPLSDNLVKFLTIFARDPAKYAALQGIRTGCCCFCSRELTHPASVTVGYGPICADKFGLPWGEAAFKNEAKTIEEIEEGL